MFEEENMSDEYGSGIAFQCQESILNKNVKSALQLYVHSLICIAGFVGNTLVILTYAFYKRTKSMTDVYLLNVAISDILFVVALPLIIYSEQSGWALGDWSCKALRGIYSINLYSGILLLACISLDRYLAIVQARRSFRLRSSTLVYSYLICAFVWILALLLSLPTFIYYERYKPSEGSFNLSYTNDFPMNDTTYSNFTSWPDEEMTLEPSEEYSCFFHFDDNKTAKDMKVLVPSSQLAVGFCLPLLVMGFCYSSMICMLLWANNFQSLKAVQVLLIMALVFVACHLPYNATILYDIVTMFNLQECYEQDRTQLALIVTESLAYLHCCLNPLLYAFISVKFRSHFHKIIEDKSVPRHGSQPTSLLSSGCENYTPFTT